MKQENKKPLYKVLNEQRPEIKFDVKAGDKNFMRLVGYIPNMESPLNFKEQSEQSEQLRLAGKYTALAVNNLHHLAEALEELHKAAMDVGITEWWQKHTETVAKAKEALNRIS